MTYINFSHNIISADHSLIFWLISKFFRINERIRTPTIRLINADEGQVGIIAIDKALVIAKEQELDLVEVAPNANPPVCKIMDFGKFLYRQKKQEQKMKKSQKQGEVKGIRLSMRTDTHDLEIKAAKAKEFLKERNLVKVAMILRGRELGRIELARAKMNAFATMLAEAGQMEETPKKQGSNLIMVFIPK